MLFIPAAVMIGGCGPSVQQPISTAPPIAGGGYNSQAQMGGQQPGSAGVYQWQDVPAGQQVPVTRAVFDQGGYQIFAQSGETIIVPFVNQNLYAMKFGQTPGNPYFVNEGSAPVLYLSPGMAVENAAAQGARWYPFSQGFAYRQPVYVDRAELERLCRDGLVSRNELLRRHVGRQSLLRSLDARLLHQHRRPSL